MSEMLMREIGSSGVRASAMGLGTWAIGGWMWGGTDEAEAIKTVEASLDEGVTLVDSAPAYGMGRAEEILGRALRGRRDKAVISTSVAWYGTYRRVTISSRNRTSPFTATLAPTP